MSRRMSNVGEQVSKTMESAKETVAKVGESVSDFFQGNPFSTAVGRKIELATDSNILATENWGLNMEICDFINGTEDGPRDAIRAIKKRLQTNMAKNNAIVMYTLTVLETCVKNCDHRFHSLVCGKDFVQELVKLIGPKFDAPQVIQERVLGLIQAWADAFRNRPDLQGVVQCFDDLKAKGVEFPAADLDTLAPILTPKRTVYQEPQPTPAVQRQQNFQVLMFREDNQEPILATPEQLTKLRHDMDIVNQNIKVFRETLTSIIPKKESAEELQLLADLNLTCLQMQKRILDLIRVVVNEEVTFELLSVNDALNNVFDKYKRLLQNVNGEGESTGNLIDIASDQVAGLNIASGSYAANSEPQAAVGLATAVNSKIPSDAEAAEMANWLEAQGKPEEKKSDPENDKL